MKLTQFTDYSLRVLMFLAVHPDEKVSIAQIASAYEISENHLMKVVHLLGQLELIRTERGRGGGMRLASSPDQIRIGEVVRQTEPDFELVECFDPQRCTCRIAPECVLRRALGEAQAAFLAVLDRYTLADLTAQPKNRLLTLLGLPR